MKKAKQAAALEYNSETLGAPRIVAVGEGLMAEKIIALAQEHDVPVYTDVETVGKLVRIPIGRDIPRELYMAVAKILAFIYSLEQEQKNTGRVRKR